LQRISWGFNQSLTKLLINNKFVNLDLILNNKNNNFAANIAFCSSDLFGVTKSQLLKYLSKDEIKDYNNLENDFLKKKYLDSNVCAKYAISQIAKIDDLSKIKIHRGIFGQPYIIAAKTQKFVISIANKVINGNNITCAIAFEQQFPMAIDLENMDNKNSSHIVSQMTNFEIENFGVSHQDLIRIWSAKEALSKVTLCGLNANFKIFEISQIIQCNNYIEYYFKNFSQYKAHSKVIDSILITIIYHKNYNIRNN
tara:strand:- start:28742 stop:29503 length:762 start_codon:yes stop_codon:yes gene_type:complete